MRTLIVHNTRSGFGSDAIFEFERSLVEAGDECVLRVLSKNTSARESVRDAESFDVVVVSGGDGTVTNILYELRKRDVVTCVFPSGTANLFFANIGSAMEPQAIAAACRALRCADVDMGEMRWTSSSGTSCVQGFGIMAGFGFDAQLMRAAIPNKKSLGEAAYFTAALSNIHPDVVRFAIECDGEAFEREGIACIVANNATMQGDLEIVPNSTMDDGLLDVIVIETSSTVRLLRPFFAGLVDKSGNALGRPYIEHLVGKNIKVTASKPLPMQIDGEVMEGLVSTYTAEVIPHCVKLIVDSSSRYQPADGPVEAPVQQAFPTE